MYEKIRLRLQTEAYLDDLKVIEVSEVLFRKCSKNLTFCRFQSQIGCAQFVTKILPKMDQLLLKLLAVIASISELLVQK